MKLLISFVLFYAFISINAQEKDKVYDPNINATQQIADAVAKATKEGKHVYLQIGGNWCSWCIMMHRFYSSDAKIDSTMNANYVVEMVNYSKENPNTEVMTELGFPQRFGFPVVVILDGAGNRIHTQNTICLEEGRGYNPKKFLKFLYNWSPAALNPESYKR